MWDLVLREMLLVTGVPPGLPMQNAAVHVLYIPDVIFRGTATARARPRDANAAAPWLVSAGAAQLLRNRLLLLPYGSFGSPRR